MRTITSLLFALLACAAFAFTFGVSTNAEAMEPEGLSDSLTCYDDYDCPSGYNCEYGECVASRCGYYSHYNSGPIIAVFDYWPGNHVTVTGKEQNLYSYQSCNNAACTTRYTSRAHYDVPECNKDICYYPTYYMCSGTCAGGDPTNTFRHSHHTRAGKYRVKDTGEKCNWSGGYVVELIPCNC